MLPRSSVLIDILGYLPETVFVQCKRYDTTLLDFYVSVLYYDQKASIVTDSRDNVQCNQIYSIETRSDSVETRNGTACTSDLLTNDNPSCWWCQVSTWEKVKNRGYMRFP